MSDATATKPKRVRCSGECNALFDPSDLRQVGMKRRLCETCLLVEAEAVAGATPATLPSREWVFEMLPDEPHPDWPGRRGRLSPSEIGKILSCPEQWRLEKLLGWRQPQNSRQIVGNAAHTTCEAFWRHRMHGETLDSKTIHATALAAFDAEVEKELDRKNSLGIVWREPIDLCREETAHLTTTYLEVAQDHILPLSMEAVTVVRVPGVPVPIASVADVIRGEADDEGELQAVAIVDTKFGAKAHKDAGAYWAAQGLIQQLGQPLACEWHSVSWNGSVNGPWNEPGLSVAPTAARYVIGAELVRRAYETVLLYFDRYGKDQVWPGAITRPQTCGMCDHRSACSWWTGETWLSAAGVEID